MSVIIETNFTDLKLFKKGKVRDVYEVENKLLIVATDRISAFDAVLPTPIPEKGQILTKICVFWFNLTKHIIENHFITDKVFEFPQAVQKYKEVLSGRSMMVKKVTPIPVECVVRGWLAGSGWKEYQENRTVCGIKLPEGLIEAAKLPQPIFTPTTKAHEGHDMPLTYSEVENIVGKEVAQFLELKSIELYKFATEYMEEKGVIVADTKFEFGITDDEIVLIDELFTPDSSRYWPLSDYKPGGAQKSFDKQFVRDYLEHIGWDKKPPAPELPPDVTRKTKEKYLEIEKILSQ